MADKDFRVKNGIVVNTAFTANSTQFALGSNVVVNTSTISVGNSTVNATINATGYFINGAIAPAPPAGSNTQIQFNDSGSANGTAAITFDKTSNTFSLSNTSSLLIGNSTINTTANSISVIAQVGYLNQNSLSFGTYTTNASLNMMLVGPYTVSSGNTLIISPGTRTIIV
jgi:hypothetical protein